MAAKSLSSLVIDELLTRGLKRVRRRASINPLFKGIVVPLDDSIGHRVIATGSFEATQIEGISRLLDYPERFGLPKRRGTFVDVGANIGLFTIAFQGYFDKTIAIEANPLTFSILKANIALRELHGINCICMAASDAAGSATLSFPANGNLGWATLNDFGYERKVTVEKARLDEMIPSDGEPIGLVKIDVEHYELEVLRGATGILKRDRPIVLFESLGLKNASQCADVLVECGYSRFFKFARKIEWRGLLSGHEVSIEEMAADGIKNAALVCAV